VNIIPYNPVPGLPFESPSAQRALAFQNAIRLADIPVYTAPRAAQTPQRRAGNWPRALMNVWRSVKLAAVAKTGRAS